MTRKVVLVTGAAKRLGAEIASVFHGQGYDVVIHYNTSGKAADQLVNRLNALRSGSATTVSGDLKLQESYADIIQTAFDFKGRLDVLVNSASIFHHHPFLESTAENWELMVTVNLKAVFFLSQIAAPMLAQVGGAIVNICDIFSKKPKFEYSIYSMTKAGLRSLTQSLAQELAPSVRVNGVAPGAIMPPNTNINRPYVSKALLPDSHAVRAVSEAVFFAATNQFMTGEVVTIDGGKTLR